MRLLGWALLQCDWCPYRERQFGQRDTRRGHTHTQREDHMKTGQERGCLQTKERGLRGNQTCQDLDLGLPASRTVKRLSFFFFFFFCRTTQQVGSLFSNRGLNPCPLQWKCGKINLSSVHAWPKLSTPELLINQKELFYQKRRFSASPL